MALAPEFFVLLGINVFLAASIITALLDRHLPSLLQYLFQGAAGAGLGELLLNQEATSATRVWASIVYLAFALSSLVAVNIRLAIVRRGMNIASMFSQMVTVPVVMISALFLSSFLENGGDLVFSPASILTIAVLVLVADLSIFGLLREYSKQGTLRTGGLVSLPTSPLPALKGNVDPSFAPHPLSGQEEDWEESPKQKED